MKCKQFMMHNFIRFSRRKKIRFYKEAKQFFISEIKIRNMDNNNNNYNKKSNIILQVNYKVTRQYI